MATAIVLIDAQVDQIPEVARHVASITAVDQVFSVTGDVDLIAIVRTAHHEELADIIPGQIAKAPGVRAVKTYLAFQEFSTADLDAAFDLGLN
ncbi:Lrp/AsnC family transcriptional regulator [Arcanobacterium bovis]|uniref:Lrp/AsnC family transcriptional regulator n=1 Tax=Arcanobacterium bovis TaxID=2529275 RepID=A0A4Q9V176_9ACTO|nr:Lrp/AsnC ligand binding domain-containing protein [Arcanobacterium bovis]TBW22836.1 Lrp/AsnC family transcriptional regulator [Arcanobacterium bovis]